MLRALAKIEVNADAGHPLSGALRGLRSLDFNVKGSGAFRAVYGVVDDDTVCVIVIVGPHENIYDKAERRMRAMLASGDM